MKPTLLWFVPSGAQRLGPIDSARFNPNSYYIPDSCAQRLGHHIIRTNRAAGVKHILVLRTRFLPIDKTGQVLQDIGSWTFLRV
ncbi:hypothetical protein QYM36_013955, partial [Artemia franciscana]